MMLRAALAASVLLLTGCVEAPRDTPLGRCERQADADPVVKQEWAIAAGSESWRWQNAGRMQATRQAAIDRCLYSTGTQLHRGGVERAR